MDQELLKFAISQGLFAALFVWLLIDTRKESKNREESLNKTIEENKKSATDREDKLNKALTENQIILVENQRIISELTDKFNLVEDIKLDIKELKDKLLEVEKEHGDYLLDNDLRITMLELGLA